MADPAAFGPGELETALSSVARAIAESLELTEVWGRVADACRAVVPFDGMGVSRLEPRDRVRVVVAAGDPAVLGLQGRVFPRSDFSARMWPRTDGFVVLVGDAERELDQSFPVDKEVTGLGFRSLLRLPLGHGEDRLGSMVLVSRRPACFTKEHAAKLVVVAEMVALALAHERLARRGHERRRRREAIERLVPALTGKHGLIPGS